MSCHFTCVTAGTAETVAPGTAESVALGRAETATAGRAEFHETSLPPIEHLTRENYERAHHIWSRFGIKHATISRPLSTFRRFITD